MHSNQWTWSIQTGHSICLASTFHGFSCTCITIRLILPLCRYTGRRYVACMRRVPSMSSVSHGAEQTGSQQACPWNYTVLSNRHILGRSRIRNPSVRPNITPLSMLSKGCLIIFIHLLYMKPKRANVNAIRCKTAHCASVHWQLQG